MKYKFTIITVCYNSERYIEKTIKSLLEQKFKNFQYIIKDGNSQDMTLEIVQRCIENDDRVKVISNRDNGIYDAMNQAIDFAKGEYVFFLNSGDMFADKDVLEKIDNFLNNNICQVVYGDIIQNDNGLLRIRKYGNICKSKYYFLTGDCICHQALFVRRELFEQKKFDTNYNICADREWQMYQIIKRKAKYKRINLLISEFMLEGYSKNNINTLENEAYECIRNYLPKVLWIYIIVYKLKKNNFAVRIFRKIENIFFVRRK